MARVKKWRKVFIAALRKGGNVRHACIAAAVTRQGAYKARRNNEVFALAWEDALADSVDTLEEEAWKRAKDSSDGLLRFLLKAHRRDMYGDHQRHEISGAGGGAVEVIVNWDGEDK